MKKARFNKLILKDKLSHVSYPERIDFPTPFKERSYPERIGLPTPLSRKDRPTPTIKGRALRKGLIPIVFLCLLFVSVGLGQEAVWDETKDTLDENIQESGPIPAKLKKSVDKIFSLGVSYYRRKMYEEALSAFQIALSFDPGNKRIESYVSLAQDEIGGELLKTERDKQDTAEKALKKRIYDLYAAGLYAVQYNRLEDAILYFQEVLKLNPHHQGAWGNIVGVRTELERQKKLEASATEQVAEAVGLAKKRAVIEKKEEKLRPESAPKKVAELQEKETRKRALVAEEEGNQLEQIYSYAKNLLNFGRFEEAELEFHKIEDVDPQYRDTPYYLADIYKIKEAQKRENEPVKYTLGPGDILEINILGHTELSGPVTIEAGGEIILPLIKEVVMATGLTKEELAEQIKGVLTKYVREPDIQIVIKGYYSKKWYILGEVGAKGEYPLGKTNLTLMEALYQAGLPVEGVAAMRRVLLIKPHKTHPRYRAINVFDILYYGRLKDNVRIEPGDIIYVPKTVFAKVADIVSRISSPLGPTKTSLEDLLGVSAAARKATPLKEILGPIDPSKK